MRNIYIYVLIPVVLFAAFLFTPGGGYFSAMKELEDKNAKVALQKQQEKDAEELRRKQIEERATADAKKRQEQRDAEERAKEQKKIKEYEDAMRLLKDEADKYVAEADKNQKDTNALELELNQLRSTKEKVNREAFDLSKQVELAKVARRNAELEIQRMVDMVAQRLGASSLAQMPPPPAPKSN